MTSLRIEENFPLKYYSVSIYFKPTIFFIYFPIQKNQTGSSRGSILSKNKNASLIVYLNDSSDGKFRALFEQEDDEILVSPKLKS